MTDEALDRRFAALGGVEPPRALQVHVLSQVGLSPGQIARLTEAPAPAPGGGMALPDPPPYAPSWGGGAEPPRNAPPRGWARPQLAAIVAGLVAAAAAVLLALPTSPERADPAALVPRGAGDAAPTVALRVAVRSDDGVERLAAGRVYRAGDTLLFRVTVQAPTEVVLRRDAVLLYRGAVPAGDSDLPIGYALEAGEGPARFSVEAGGASASVVISAVSP